MGAEDLGTIWQRDTYFVVSTGRLKLREQQPGCAQLIQYDREDQPHERESQYRIAPLGAPKMVLSVLEACLGVRVVIAKHRHLFRIEGVRIHLDEVGELGNFIELEAVAPAHSDLVDEQRLVSQLRNAFRLSDDLLVPKGYAELLLAQH